jgi:predicted PurR-regulated permease PerM
MNQTDREFENRIASRLLDVLIRAGLILALVVLCYKVFAPFFGLMVGALVVAVMLYPLHQWLARRIGDRQGFAATLIVISGIVLIAIPAVPLIGSLGELAPRLVAEIRANTLVIPAPSAAIKDWPLVGERIHAAWSMAHSDLPALIQNLHPQIGNLTRSALRIVGTLGVDLVQFFISFIIAGIIMAFGESGARSCRAIAERIVGPGRGVQLLALSVSPSA